MKFKKLRSYKKVGKNGKTYTVFVYAVSGTPEQLAKYKALQGDNHRADEDGTPLWFSTRFVGETGALVMNDKGVYADMSEFDAAASLADQYGGNLGQELARAAAGKLMGNPIQDSVPATEQKTAE